MARAKILLGHGSGGKLTHQLIESVFQPPMANPFIKVLDDSAVCPLGNSASLHCVGFYEDITSKIQEPFGIYSVSICAPGYTSLEPSRVQYKPNAHVRSWFSMV